MVQTELPVPEHRPQAQGTVHIVLVVRTLAEPSSAVAPSVAEVPSEVPEGVAGLLQLAGYFGAFDIFGYAFSTFRSVRRYEDLFAYSEAKKEKRHRGNWYFMPWLLVGAGFLLVGLCLGIGL